MTETSYLKITADQVSNVFCTLVQDMQVLIAKPTELRPDLIMTRIDSAKFDLFTICNSNSDVQDAQESVKPTSGRATMDKLPIPTFGAKK